MPITLPPRATAMQLIQVGPQDGALYFRLEPELQRPCDGCCCTYCSAHPELTPMWDTLAVHPSCRWTWTVHMPDPDNGWRKGHTFAK